MIVCVLSCFAETKKKLIDAVHNGGGANMMMHDASQSQSPRSRAMTAANQPPPVRITFVFIYVQTFDIVFNVVHRV